MKYKIIINQKQKFKPHIVTKERLPITKEEILVLKQEGLSNRQIAKKFDCSEKTIRNRLNEVRKTL